MDKHKFYEDVLEILQTQLDELELGLTATLTEVEKAEGCVSAIVCKPNNEIQGAYIQEIFYVNLLWDRFKCFKQPARDAAMYIINTITSAENHAEFLSNIDGIANLDYVLANVIPCVITEAVTDKYRDLYVTVEHNDVEFVFRVVVPAGDACTASYLVSRQMLCKFGISERHLLAKALANLRSVLPVKVAPLEDFLPEVVRRVTDNIYSITVITTEAGLYGASYITDRAMLKAVADMLNDDIYLIVSSIHELLAVPAEHGTPKDLCKMNREINRTEVGADCRAKDMVFKYVRSSDTVTLIIE